MGGSAGAAPRRDPARGPRSPTPADLGARSPVPSVDSVACGAFDSEGDVTEIGANNGHKQDLWQKHGFRFYGSFLCLRNTNDGAAPAKLAFIWPHVCFGRSLLLFRKFSH